MGKSMGGVGVLASASFMEFVQCCARKCLKLALEREEYPWSVALANFYGLNTPIMSDFKPLIWCYRTQSIINVIALYHELYKKKKVIIAQTSWEIKINEIKQYTPWAIGSGPVSFGII